MLATAVDIQTGEIPYEYYINSLMVTPDETKKKSENPSKEAYQVCSFRSTEPSHSATAAHAPDGHFSHISCRSVFASRSRQGVNTISVANVFSLAKLDR